MTSTLNRYWLGLRSTAIPVLGAAVLLLFGPSVFAGDALRGTIDKIDSAAKTVVVKTADGTEQTVHFVDSTLVHGGKTVGADADHAIRDMKKGGEVVVHYSGEGAEKTAVEVDHVGKGGLKVAEGSITHFDHAAKTVTIKTAKGAELTFAITALAAEETGKDIAEGAGKSAKVTVHYSERAGQKMAYLITKIV